MRDKIIKIILMALPIILAIGLVGTNIRNCSLRRSDSERAAELERINTELEANLAESNRIRAEDARIRREAESELIRLRKTLEQTESYIAELRDENNRYRDTIDKFADIRRELAGETGELEGLAQRIGDGARAALEIVERLQAGSGEAD